MSNAQVQQNDRGAHLALSPLEWELQTVHAPSSQARGTGLTSAAPCAPLGTPLAPPLSSSACNPATTFSTSSLHSRASSSAALARPHDPSAPAPQARIAAALPLRRALHVGSAVLAAQDTRPGGSLQDASAASGPSGLGQCVAAEPAWGGPQSCSESHGRRRAAGGLRRRCP